MINATEFCRGRRPAATGRQGLLSLAVVLVMTVGSSATGPAATGLPKEITGEDGTPMVLIPAGEFLMGSPDGVGDEDERPQHRVWIDAFYLDTHEVTTAQYEKFMEETGHMRPEFWPFEELSDFELGHFRERPVVGVDWKGALEYCVWLGKRLPTEAEWEYAARGPDGRSYPWGEADPTAELANAGKTWSPKFYRNRLERVGSHPGGQSPFGVHDMGGNAMEWVADWYDPKYYARSPEKNPPGPESGSQKVLRGGSWNFAAKYMRTASRLRFPAMHRAADIGVRCARDAEPQG